MPPFPPFRTGRYTIDYDLTAVTPTTANGLDAELSGTFSYDDTPGLGMPITALNLLLTTSSFSFTFDQLSQVTNAEPAEFSLLVQGLPPGPPPSPSVIELGGIATIFWDLGTPPAFPVNTLESDVVSDREISQA